MRCALFDEIRRAERVVLFGRTATPPFVRTTWRYACFLRVGVERGCTPLHPAFSARFKNGYFPTILRFRSRNGPCPIRPQLARWPCIPRLGQERPTTFRIFHAMSKGTMRDPWRKTTAVRIFSGLCGFWTDCADFQWVVRIFKGPCGSVMEILRRTDPESAAFSPKKTVTGRFRTADNPHGMQKIRTTY